jgi:hypothetical protein
MTTKKLLSKILTKDRVTWLKSDKDKNHSAYIFMNDKGLITQFTSWDDNPNIITFYTINDNCYMVIIDNDGKIRVQKHDNEFGQFNPILIEEFLKLTKSV